MTLHSRLLTCLVASLIAGCVTINIYFPAAAAEKVADKMIDEIWQTQPKAAPESPKEKTP